MSSNGSKRNPDGDDIIDLFQQFLVQSPSDFSITILPTTHEDASSTSSKTTSGTSPPQALPQPSLVHSIVLVDGHLGIDARSLPWITRELRKSYRNLRNDKHGHWREPQDNDTNNNVNHLDSENGEAETTDAQDSLTTKMIQLTACLLLVNPDHSTVWADRRRALLRITRNNNKNRCLKIWKGETTFLDLLFTQHSKAPTSWAHRKYCLRQISILLDGHDDIDTGTNASRLDVARHEIRMCADVAEKYPKNYYAWTHRLCLWSLLFPKQLSVEGLSYSGGDSNDGISIKMVELKMSLLKEEMDCLWKWLRFHPSDHSAVHYTGTVIGLFLEPSRATYDQLPDIKDTIDYTMSRVKELVTEHGDHESIWILRRSITRILWEHSVHDRVVGDMQSVLDAVKHKSSCLDHDTHTARWYRLTYLAWCFANLQGPSRQKLMSYEDVRMILDELITGAGFKGQEFWKQAGSKILLNDGRRDPLSDWSFRSTPSL